MWTADESKGLCVGELVRDDCIKSGAVDYDEHKGKRNTMKECFMLCKSRIGSV